MSTSKCLPKLPNPQCNFFGWQYQRHPDLINCTSWRVTTALFFDRSHPFHIRTVRNAESFNSAELHWTIRVSNKVSTKSTVRNHILRRVRSAFKAELKHRGWESDGSPRPDSGQRPLRGALSISVLAKDAAAVLQASNQELRTDLWQALKHASIKSLQPLELNKLSEEGDRIHPPAVDADVNKDEQTHFDALSNPANTLS